MTRFPQQQQEGSTGRLERPEEPVPENVVTAVVFVFAWLGLNVGLSYMWRIGRLKFIGWRLAPLHAWKLAIAWNR